MKYALFTVSTPTLTPEEVAPRLSQLGYDGVEWRVVDEPPNPKGMEFWHGNRSTIPLTGFADNVARILSLQTDNGLELPNLGTYVRCNESWDDIVAAFDAAVALSSPSLRISVPNYRGDEPFLPLWNASREQYRKIAALAEERGVRALIELHMNTIVPSASAAVRFFDGFNPAHVGVIYDNGNLVYEGFENYRMGLEILGDLLAHVHIKNARWFPLRYRDDRSLSWMCDFAAVHEGISDVESLCRALLDIGYDGWISFEDFSTMRPLDVRMEGNITYVKSVFERLLAERHGVADTNE